jgi:hypothetical protein
MSDELKCLMRTASGTLPIIPSLRGAVLAAIDAACAEDLANANRKIYGDDQPFFPPVTSSEHFRAELNDTLGKLKEWNAHD